MKYLQINIRLLRELSQLTQKELEDALGLTRGVLSSYEKGTALPRLNNLYQLVKLFRVDFPELTIDAVLDENLSLSLGSNKEAVKLDLNEFENVEHENKVDQKGRTITSINERNIEIISKNKNIDESFKKLMAEQIVFGGWI